MSLGQKPPSASLAPSQASHQALGQAPAGWPQAALGPLALRRRLGEGGQAIAEFGLVLPMLALLTFGTIEVAIYLQQQAALNGVAFVAARAASVTGGEGRYGKDAANEVAKAAGMPWLERAAASTRMEAGAGATRAQLKAKVDRFSGIISALSGGKAKGFDELGAMSTLPLEWEAKRHRQTNATGKPRTMYRVNYAGKLPMPDPLAKAKALVQKVRDAAAKIPLEIVVPAPTPKPTPKPTPRPTPKPGASTEPGGPSIITPGKPTPAPKPTAPPQPRRFVVPGARELRAFPFGNGAEPFSDRYAVVANPRARNDAGDGGQGTSSQYLSSRYEDGPPVSGEFPWKLSTLMEGLTSYGELLGGKTGDGSLGYACKQLGPWPPPAVRTVINTNPVAAGLLRVVDTGKKAIGAQGATIASSLDKAYVQLEKQEKGLFRGRAR